MADDGGQMHKVARQMVALGALGALALSGTLAYRLWRLDRAPAADSGELRVAAFEQQVQAFAEVDERLILYQETAALVPPGLRSLAAIAVDGDDRIYAGGGPRLSVFTAQGEAIRQMPTEGDITALALDEENNLYVGLGNAVHAYDADGAKTAVFSGIRPDAIVTSLAAGYGKVFVADAQSRTVLRFTPDGTLQRTIDGRDENGVGPGFVAPSPSFALTLGAGRTLWIVNPGRHRLDEYNFDGERIHGWSRGSGLALEAFSGCCNPCHVARLSDGSLVTSEKGLPRVKVYTRRGDFVGVVAAPNQFDSRTPNLALAVDVRDRILVADPDRMQVRVFEKGTVKN